MRERESGRGEQGQRTVAGSECELRESRKNRGLGRNRKQGRRQQLVRRQQ